MALVITFKSETSDCPTLTIIMPSLRPLLKALLLFLTLEIIMPLVKFFNLYFSKNLITATYEKNSSDFGEIINYFNQNNIKIEDISTEDGDLEDVFVQLTKH